MAILRDVFGGLGRIDVSNQAIPSFEKNQKLCSSITRVVISILAFLLAFVSLIAGCVCCASGGLSLYCGLVTIIGSVLGVIWSSIVFKRMFEKKVS
ncbi:hypothetical protein [Chlamydia felis]|nr:hypothetical protein [Chlamydia felis]